MEHGMSNGTKAQALADRYPYMFQQPELLDIYAGWLGPLERLCACIHERLRGRSMSFHFLQIKEKFGTCRIYVHLGLPRSEPETAIRLQEVATLRQSIQDDVEIAESACGLHCMVCGEDAITQSHGAVLATLCERHALSESMRDPWTLAKAPITSAA